MLRYLINRALLMIPTLLGVAILVFFMLRLMPGDPVQMMMDGANVSKQVIDAERARLGLDQPIYIQFVKWLGSALTRDFGYSIWTGKPGLCSVEMIPCLLKLWGCPLGEDGFRSAYREGALSFDANRICEVLLRTGPINTYNLRKRVGLASNTAKRAFVELQKKLVIAKCGKEAIAKIWEAEVLDLTARVFPKAHSEARGMSFLVARESALEAMKKFSPEMPKKLLARLLRVGVE